MEAAGGEEDGEGADDGEGEHLGPEDRGADAFEEDAADDDEEVAKRIA